MNASLIANVVCCSSTQSSAPKTLHMNENQTYSYLRSSAATGNGLKQCSELIFMISGQHPCNNYTSHIRPHFARVPPLNLFACIMKDLNKRSSFINAVIYIYDQCTFVVRACCQRAQDERCHCQWGGLGPPRVRSKLSSKIAVQTPLKSV